MRITIIAGAAAATLAAVSVAPAKAGSGLDTYRQAGTLTCSVQPKVGLVFGSERTAECTFVHHGRRHSYTESYSGAMSRVGFDIGISGAEVISWNVYTPRGYARRGMLAGSHTGSSGEATLVAGPGTLSSFDASGSRFVLEQTGSSGEAGMNLGFGVTALDLSPAWPTAFTSFR